MPQDCPTCGEFRKLQSSVSELQYQYLHYIQKLEEKLEAVEARLAKIEDCDCHKSCRLPGGLIREDGASWSDDQCQLCSCVVSLRPVGLKISEKYSFLGSRLDFFPHF